MISVAAGTPVEGSALTAEQSAALAGLAIVADANRPELVDVVLVPDGSRGSIADVHANANERAAQTPRTIDEAAHISLAAQLASGALDGQFLFLADTELQPVLLVRVAPEP